MRGKRNGLGALLGAAVWTSATAAQAFCGVYISSAETELGNDSSFVVLLRDGTRTVMTMRNDYVGPPSDFAMVVPLPASIGEDDVHVIDEDVLDAVERFTSPRLVEYWENEPYCPSPLRRHAGIPMLRSGAAGVTVETSFAVGEYDFSVLSAGRSLALEQWLTQEGYRIPPNAAPLLRPYVENGYRFLVAKVDTDRVTFVDGKAELSPVRIAYDSTRLELPLRLGLANSRGVQDVVAVVISRDGRYEVANRPNVFVPTNLEVRPEARSRFSELYASILDRTFERNPGAVITEHAWNIAGCDPCTGPTIDVPKLDLLGGDVISGTIEQPTRARDVHFAGIVRRAGEGHGERAVATFLENRKTQIAACGAGYGITETHMDLSFAADGGLTRLETPGPENQRSECLARALRGSRLFAPPLRIASSRFRVNLRYTPRYRPSQRSAAGFTATRLHLRVKPGGETTDLVFRRAHDVTGGVGAPDARGVLPPTERTRDGSTFQARYGILNRWTEPVACEDPVHTGWGGEDRRYGALAMRAERATTEMRSGDVIRDLVVAPPRALRPHRASVRTSRDMRPEPRADLRGPGSVPPGEPAPSSTRIATLAVRRFEVG